MPGPVPDNASRDSRPRGRSLAVVLSGLAVAALVVVGFGSLANAEESSGSAGETGAAGTPAAGPHGLHRLTDDQETCLKNALGDLPRPTAGARRTPPTAEQIQKLQDAATSCGITLPARGPGTDSIGHRPGFPGLTDDQQSCLKNALGDLPRPTAGARRSATPPTAEQIQKLQDAATTCGITLPTPPAFGAPVGADAQV